nr:uncharacterized protein LOC110383290 isoform X1 [Helicoverpa armigera]
MFVRGFTFNQLYLATTTTITIQFISQYFPRAVRLGTATASSFINIDSVLNNPPQCQAVQSVPRADHFSSVSDVEQLAPLLAGSPPLPLLPAPPSGARRDFMPLGENSDMVLRYMHAPRRRPPPWLTRP